MKLWLDDERPAPSEWIRENTVAIATTAPAAIDFLRAGIITEVSLDHDLGPVEAGTGYDVIAWIEERVATDHSYRPPIIYIHTANPAARVRMLAARDAIDRIVKEREP